MVVFVCSSDCCIADQGMLYVYLSVQLPEPVNTVFKDGFLLKKTSRPSFGWKNCYFVLQGAHLFYFEHKKVIAYCLTACQPQDSSRLSETAFYTKSANKSVLDRAFWSAFCLVIMTHHEGLLFRLFLIRCRFRISYWKHMILLILILSISV